MTEVSKSSDTASLPAAAAEVLATAVAHLERGEAESALRAASEACHAAPQRPEPHYAFGQAWSLLGDHARAEQAFARAIQLRPDWTDAWINYGIAHYRQGEIEHAKTAMRQALRHAPGHTGAAANLAAFLRLTGASEAAETVLRSLLMQEPGHVAARLNLAADLLQEERSDEALAVLGAAPPPAEPLAAQQHHLACALAHLQRGRLAEARAALASCAAVGPLAAALAPVWHWREVLLALAEGRPKRAHRAADAMERALASIAPNALPEHRIMAHFDLAKFWSAENAHPRAFGHWVAGHRLLGRSQPFSRAAYRATVDVMMATFTRERFAAGPRAQNHDGTPVFIVGMPRSGTTLCEQILAAHRDVAGAGERIALGQTFRELAGDEDEAAIKRLAGLDAAVFDRAAEAYLAELHALAPEAARIVDKMPGNYLYLGLAGLMLPGAKILHCVRDPRDIGLSIFTFRFYGDHPYAHDLGNLGFAIAEQVRLMDHFKAALPDRILTVALADWVADFDGTLARVLAHLDLPPDPACAFFYEAESRVRTVSRKQVRQPVNARGLGRWKTYERELAPMIAELEAAGLGAWLKDSAAVDR